MNTPFDYGFEYLGSSSREVITPQTERMFVTMTQAIKAHTGVLCMGPKVGFVRQLGAELVPAYDFESL